MPTVDNLNIQISASANSAMKSLDSLSKKLNTLSGSLSKSMGTVSKNNTKVATSSTKMVSGLNKTNSAMKRADKSAKSLAASFGLFYANFFLLIRGFKALWSSIESTADYIEAFNYFTVSMGKIASKWDSEWGNYADESARNYSNVFFTTLNDSFNKMSGVSYDPKTGLLSETGLKNLGANLQEVTQYAAQLASMMDSVGQSGQTTLATTNAFIKLAGDISSLYNIDYSEAANRMRSVLQGQSRAGYGFGWDTTMASLQATADKLNLSKPVSEMEQFEKQQLRILTILQQSRVAWGDQANTINTLANQMRLLRNNVKEAAMMLGQLFIPFLQKAMPVVNGLTIAIKRLLENIAVFMGVKIEDIGQGYPDLGDDIDGVTDSIEDATEASKKFKNATLGIDELNILGNQQSATGVTEDTLDLTNQIIDATKEYEQAWANAFDKMESRVDSFASKFETALEPIKTIALGFSTGDFTLVGEGVSDLATSITDLFTSAIEEVDWDELGSNCIEFLFGVDWVDIATSLTEAGLALDDALFDFFSGAINGAIAMLIDGDFEVSEENKAELAEKYKEWLITSPFTKMFTGQIFPITAFAESIAMGIYASSQTGSVESGLKNFVVHLYSRLAYFWSGEDPKEIAEAISKWWDETISPWFTAEKWESLGDGIKEGLSKAFTSALESVKQIWNQFATWLNEKLTWQIEPIVIMGKTLFEGTTISLGKLPTFATGGFPEDGLFMANHGELVGGFSNGRTAVANNEQIIEGIEGGVERAVANVLAPYLSEIAQNTRETADKDFSIGDREIARANMRGQRQLGAMLIT